MRPKTTRRVLEGVADKAELSRNRAHLRVGSFSAINAALARPRQISLSFRNDSDCRPLPAMANGPRYEFAQQAGCSWMRESSKIIAGRA